MLPKIDEQYAVLLDACKKDGVGSSIVDLVELIPGCTTYIAVMVLIHVVLHRLAAYLEEGVGNCVADEAATMLALCSQARDDLAGN